MATRWYLRNATGSATYGRAGPTAKQSSQTDSVPGGPADKNTCKAATNGKGSATATKSFTDTVGGGGARRTMVGMWAGPPLAAQSIAAGTAFTLTMGLQESAAAMNLFLAAFFYVWREGAGKVADLSADPVTDASEANVANYRWRQLSGTTAGEVTLQAGDGIVCEVWGSYDGPFIGSYTGGFRLDGPNDNYASIGEGTDEPDPASWMESSQELAEMHPYYAHGLDRQRGLR